MSHKGEVVNDKNGLSAKVQPGGRCRFTGVIYAIRCKKCKLLYIGETKKAMSDRYGPTNTISATDLITVI